MLGCHAIDVEKLILSLWIPEIPNTNTIFVFDVLQRNQPAASVGMHIHDLAHSR